ncbi:regulator of competence-specific genes [Burkholderiales bacterium JOSHI_001]|nr:regulator of competence-specific genes [Burkholderiales bacterium JOSHI_001]
MAADAELVAHCMELLGGAPRVRGRRMFGGHGFYVDDLFVALLSSERLYLKADNWVQPDFEAAGCQPFRYAGHDGQVTVMAYWTAPDEAMDSPALMQPWLRLALASALRAAAAKAPAAARKPRAAAPKAPARQPTAQDAKPAKAGRKTGRG